jgi:hypothetical protein
MARFLLSQIDDSPADREYEDGDKLCYKLAEALQMLPSSSPLLNTLRLNLDIAYDENEFPYDGFADLVDTINLIHLPLLTTLDMSVKIDEEEFGLVDPDTPLRPNFSAFLALHPLSYTSPYSEQAFRKTSQPPFPTFARSRVRSMNPPSSVAAVHRSKRL